MSCLGGKPSDPREWVRYRRDDVTEVFGRICSRTAPSTSRRDCSSCVAYRGIRSDESIANGLGPDGEPYALSRDEDERYQAALMARDLDDDDEPMFAWFGRMDREVIVDGHGKRRLIMGIGDQGLRRIGDPDALDRRAAYMRDYRTRRGNEVNRAATRARVARWRAARKASKAVT